MLRAKCMKARNIRAGSNPAGSRGAGGAGEEEQGGEQHRSLEQLSVVLVMRLKGSRCEDVEGECNKGGYHTKTTDLTHRCIGTNREGADAIDGEGDQSVEAEVRSHDGERGGPKYCMWDKEGHRFEHRK